MRGNPHVRFCRRAGAGNCARLASGYDDFHSLDLPLGKLLLLTLCEQPYPTGYDTRIPLLDAVGAVLPAALLARIPHEGITPTALHERLDGGRFAAAAEFADWLWSDTGTIFLDADQEVEVYDAEWSREVVLALAEEWRTAQAIMDRVKALEDWLEIGAPRHFAELLDAALGTTPSPNDQADGQGEPQVIEPGESNQGRSHANDTSAHAAHAEDAAH